MNKKEPEKTEYLDHPERKANLAPYIPNGVVSIDDLLEMAETLKKEGAKNVKLGGELIFVWEGNHLPAGIKERIRWEANDFKASAVRPVKTCSAETFCQRFRQPVLSLAKKIDEKFKGIHLPVKLVIGIAGCQRSCSEPGTKDIGIRSNPRGYEIMVGGSGGMNPTIAQSIGTYPDEKSVLKVIERTIEYMKLKDRKSIRLGKVIEKDGMDDYLAFINSAG